MVTREIFIANLKKLRVEKGWSQYELASHSGLSSKQISRLETGGSFPSSATLDILASTFGVPVSAFFIDPDDPFAAIDYRSLYTLVNELSTFYISSIEAATNALFDDMKSLIKENKFDRFQFERLISPTVVSSYLKSGNMDIRDTLKSVFEEMVKDSMSKDKKDE